MFSARRSGHRAKRDAGGDRHRLMVVHDEHHADSHATERWQRAIDGVLEHCALHPAGSVREREVSGARFVLALFLDDAAIDALADAVLSARDGGSEVSLIVATRPEDMTALGRWLHRRAAANRLAGVRLIVARDADDAAQQLPSRLTPVTEANVIRMPTNTEIEHAPMTSFYTFSAQTQALVRRIRAFADNGITRAYLLGGPGSGKTSLAYYYFLSRQRGRFVSVNLLAENTGDKAAVKSLLCGHVPGAFPGAGNRAGAFDLAQDGVCFIDESHGVTGPVMETLMEALDNGQYLPLGAAAKRPMRCALLFATNRSWEHLQNSVDLDEFTRLGAALLHVPPLHEREEDMIAVAATTLARLAAPCTTWQAPHGLATGAWQRIRDCQWRGNVRALVRVLEAAFVDSAGNQDTLVPDRAVADGIALWEPTEHHSHALYETHQRSRPQPARSVQPAVRG